jgi:hypothetical protein
MRQPGSSLLARAACVVFAVLSASGRESLADMAVALDSATATAAGPQAANPGTTLSMPPAGTAPSRGGELGSTPSAGAPVNATASTASTGNMLVTSLVNAMMTPNSSGLSSLPATSSASSSSGTSSSGTSLDGNSGANLLAAVSSNGAVGAGGSATLGPDFALGSQLGGTQMPLAAPEPSTLIVVVAAVPLGWYFVRRRRVQAA